MNMKSIIHISALLLFLLIHSNLVAQDAEAELDSTRKEKTHTEKKFIDKFTFGGGFGLSLGSYTRIAAAPLVGYRPIERVLVGIEGRYAYIKDTYVGYKTHYYGFGPLARVILFRGLFAQAQAEFINYDQIITLSYQSHRIWSNAVLVGAGYRQALSDRSYYFITVLWNINETGSSIYVNNPIIRMGITF